MSSNPAPALATLQRKHTEICWHLNIVDQFVASFATPRMNAENSGTESRSITQKETGFDR